MAYMNQEKKALIKAELAKVMPKGWKYSLSVRHHSTIVCTIKSAPVPILKYIKGAGGMSPEAKGYFDVNPYYLDTQFEGILLSTFQAIKTALNLGNWDRSDSQTDYFDVGHYVDLNVGTWDKPFQVTA